jgi:hypothetical protein
MDIAKFLMNTAIFTGVSQMEHLILSRTEDYTAIENNECTVLYSYTQAFVFVVLKIVILSTCRSGCT